MLPQRPLEHGRAVAADRAVVRHRQGGVERPRVVARQQALRAHGLQNARQRQARRALVAAEAGEDAGAGRAGRGEDGAGDGGGERGVEVGVGDELLCGMRWRIPREKEGDGERESEFFSVI